MKLLTADWGFTDIKEWQEVAGGYSPDRKIKVTLQNGEQWLCRIASPDKESRKREELKIMQEIYPSGIRMQKPLKLITHPDACILIVSWLPGQPLSSVIQTKSRQEQFQLGWQAGKMLRPIHMLRRSEPNPKWTEKMTQKITRRLEMFKECGETLEAGELFVRHIEARLPLLAHRPQCLLHGDHHINNLVIDDQDRIGVIDFGSWDIGDPWEEIMPILWDVRESPDFAAGRILGMLQGAVPDTFFEVMMMYWCFHIISTVLWSSRFGGEVLARAHDNARRMRQWSAELTCTVPSWLQPYLQPQDRLA